MTLLTSIVNTGGGGGGGGGADNAFKTIAVSGQSNVVADSATDILTLANGTGIAITTNATTDTITVSTTGLQTEDSDLTALADNATNGLWARTGNGTGATRDITGTNNEIDVANGDGVSGDPTISLADNPVVPGTGSIHVPSGTTAQRTGTPSNGMFRYNSSTNEFEGYADGAWGAIGGGGASAINDLSDVTITGASKGDMVVYNGSAWVDLTVGSNDQVLTADSAEAAGVKWAAASGGGGSYTALDALDDIYGLGDF